MTSPNGNELTKDGFPIINGWRRISQLTDLPGLTDGDTAWTKGEAVIALEYFGPWDAAGDLPIDPEGWELTYWPDGFLGACERSVEGAEDVLAEVGWEWRREL